MKRYPSVCCAKTIIALAILLAAVLPTIAETEKTHYETMLALAQQGYPAGMTAVGRMLCTGTDILKNEKEGLGWFEAARYTVGEEHWSSTLKPDLREYYEGIPSDVLIEAEALGVSRIKQIEYSGLSLETPQSTIVSALRYVRSFEPEQNIRGLALLYTASSRLDKSRQDPFIAYTASLITSTEDTVGKQGAIKAQNYAQRISSFVGGEERSWKNADNWKTRYLAILEVLDPEQKQREEIAIEESPEQYLGPQPWWLDDELVPTRERLYPLPSPQKSFFEKVGDLFSGSD